MNIILLFEIIYNVKDFVNLNTSSDAFNSININSFLLLKNLILRIEIKILLLLLLLEKPGNVFNLLLVLLLIYDISVYFITFSF
jgi:hypothetical protein